MADEVKKKLPKWRVSWAGYPAQEVEAKDKEAAFAEWCSLSGLHPTVQEKSKEEDGYIATSVG